jgi:hypothetical protein
MQIWVDDQAGILDAVVPPMRSLAHIETLTGFFFPAAAKSTVPLETPHHYQAQPRQSLCSSIGLRVCAEFIEGGEA